MARWVTDFFNIGTVLPPRRRVYALLIFLAPLLVACSQTGPIFPTPDHLFDWVRSPESLHPDSDRAPLIVDPVVTFQLARGERRSMLHAGHDWGLDQTYLVGFDVRLDPDRPLSRPVTLGRLLRTGGGRSEIIKVTLDPRRGVIVQGRVCIPRAELTNWHSVEIRARLMDDDSGYIEVYCDRHALWARSNMRTTLPPICRHAQGCTQRVPRPVTYDWQVGLILDRPARRETRILMRRIFFHRLFVIPHRIEKL